MTTGEKSGNWRKEAERLCANWRAGEKLEQLEAINEAASKAGDYWLLDFISEEEITQLIKRDAKIAIKDEVDSWRKGFVNAREAGYRIDDQMKEALLTLGDFSEQEQRELQELLAQVT